MYEFSHNAVTQIETVVYDYSHLWKDHDNVVRMTVCLVSMVLGSRHTE